MPSIGKVVASLATVGSIVGASAVTYFALNNTQDISGRLKEEQFTLLDLNAKEGDWNAVLTQYKLEKTQTFTGKEDKLVNEDYLKEKCKATLNKNSDDNKNYKLAKRWCVKEESIDTILGRRKYKILDTTSEKNEDDGNWTTKFRELLPNTTRFKAVEKTVKKQDDSENIKAIKAGCLALATKDTKTTSDKFSENIDLAQKWCAVKINK